MAAALQRHGLDAGLIEVEITESATMGEGSTALAALADIQALRADLCIVGLCSLAPDRLGATNDEEAVLKRAMLAGSARRAAAVLNERLTASAPFTIGVAADLDHVALEADVPADLLGLLRREGGPDLILAER